MAHIGKIRIAGTIFVETGLFIGTPEDYGISGADYCVIRDPVTLEPYIPGTTLKGRMRFLVERRFYADIVRNKGENSQEAKGFFADHRVKYHACPNPSCPICRLFGAFVRRKEEIIRPARIKVLDAYLTDAGKRRLSDLEFYTEVKTESTIDRLTAHPSTRQVERVPRGAEFSLSIFYDIANLDELEEDLRWLFYALKALEIEGVGGMSSRGYGKVKIRDVAVEYITVWDLEEEGTWHKVDGVNYEEQSPRDIAKVVAGAVRSDERLSPEKEQEARGEEK